MAKVKNEKEHKRRHKNQSRMWYLCRHIKAFLLMMLPIVRYYFDILVDKVFGFYYTSKAKPIPKITNKLVLQDAVTLARRIRKGEVTSEEVVRAFIERTQQVNSIINAVIDDRFEEAIKEAQKIDENLASGTISGDDFDKKPFLGVPFTTKESTAVEGLSNTFGLLSRKSYKAKFDAECVKRMKNAGAILIAVTNVPQLNLWVETNNPVYGLTKNPYDTTRNVGGSSGGEGSIIASCGSPIGIGTDIGGSLRIPAFMCGICAHKPTSNLISTNGLTFRTGKEEGTMVVAGPMTKTVDEITPFLKVLVGDNASKLKLDKEVDIKDIKIYYVNDPQDPFVSPFRGEMKKLLSRVINHFTQILPDKPELVTIDELRYGGRIWKYWMANEPDANFQRDLTNREGEVNSYMELLKYCFRWSEYNLAVMFVLINGILPTPNADWAQEQTNTLHNKLTAILGTNGVLIYPSAPWPASYHYTAFLRPWNMNLFSIWNALKFPVTQVPLGLGKEGLPLGLQVVAAPFQDHLAIRVAKELEKAFGGYVPPCPVDE